MRVRIQEDITIDKMPYKNTLLTALAGRVMVTAELMAASTGINTNEHTTQPVTVNIALPSDSQIQNLKTASWLAETGTATIYAAEMEGRYTASGEPYDPELLTAAHKTIPLGSLVRVTNLKSDAQVVVRINDRWGSGGVRVINLSKHAAMELNFGSAGTAPVRLEVESLAHKQAVTAVSRAETLPARLGGTELNHSKMQLCQNEAEILGLSGDLFHNHIKLCLGRTQP